jgi:hypothetical protein
VSIVARPSVYRVKVHDGPIRWDHIAQGRADMAKFVYTYSGGRMPETDAEREAVMAAWGGWLGGMGAAALDPGNPFGASATVSADGSVGDAGAAGIGGYSIVAADSLAAATEMAKGCPILSAGGSVDVYEVHEMM